MCSIGVQWCRNNKELQGTEVVQMYTVAGVGQG
jgi:hypothetical protein